MQRYGPRYNVVDKIRLFIHKVIPKDLSRSLILGKHLDTPGLEKEAQLAGKLVIPEKTKQGCETYP